MTLFRRGHGERISSVELKETVDKMARADDNGMGMFSREMVVLHHKALSHKVEKAKLFKKNLEGQFEDAKKFVVKQDVAYQI